jgi:hypothetical protein
MASDDNSKSPLHLLQVRLPVRIAQPLQRATEHLTISQSDYTRQALVSKLEADGYLSREVSA